MWRRGRLALLMIMAAGAIWSAQEAWKTLRPRWETELPREIYAAFLSREEEANYRLEAYEGRVAVYSAGRERKLLALTRIELKNLRAADRAMLLGGIPVPDRYDLLLLLEDLGS